MPNFIDLTGRVFGELKVVQQSKERIGTKVTWLCLCSCGKHHLATADNLRSGQCKSCGCRWGRFSHGQSATANRKGQASPTYRSWQAMKQRCTNPNHMSYPRYGGVGVTVCKRWMTFDNFLADMGERPDGHTLDRKNGKRGYSKANCRWATNQTQFENKRVVRNSSGKFT